MSIQESKNYPYLKEVNRAVIQRLREAIEYMDKNGISISRNPTEKELKKAVDKMMYSLAKAYGTPPDKDRGLVANAIYNLAYGVNIPIGFAQEVISSIPLANHWFEGSNAGRTYGKEKAQSTSESLQKTTQKATVSFKDLYERFGSSNSAPCSSPTKNTKSYKEIEDAAVESACLSI